MAMGQCDVHWPSPVVKRPKQMIGPGLSSVFADSRFAMPLGTMQRWRGTTRNSDGATRDHRTLARRLLILSVTLNDSNGRKTMNANLTTREIDNLLDSMNETTTDDLRSLMTDISEYRPTTDATDTDDTTYFVLNS